MCAHLSLKELNYRVYFKSLNAFMPAELYKTNTAIVFKGELNSTQQRTCLERWIMLTLKEEKAKVYAKGDIRGLCGRTIEKSVY